MKDPMHSNIKKILLNATTNMIGGSVQVALSVIESAFKFSNKDIIWQVAVSRQIYEQLPNQILACPYLEVFDISPAKSLQGRRRLKKLEEKWSPIAVFTIMGPSYVRFAAPHFCGVGDGWVTHSNRLAYSSLPTVFSKVKKLLQCTYKAYWYRQANYWFVESEVAKNGLQSRLKIEQCKITKVPNIVSRYYSMGNVERKSSLNNKLISFIVVGASYPHKNLLIIPPVIKKLLEMKVQKFSFTLTINPADRAWKEISHVAKNLGVKKFIKTSGKFRVCDGPELYRQADFLFFPTLLESCSVTPLEANAMGVPIIASDILANREAIGDHAIYFDPSSVDSAVYAIIDAIANYEYCLSQVDALRKVLFGDKYSPKARFETYQNEIIKFMNKNNQENFGV